jgi:hypothetical protein
VLNRRDFVEAAPTLPGDPRFGLPPASPHRYDGKERKVSHPPSVHQRLVAHFPHLNQVTLIERYVSDLDGTPRSAVAALGITSLPATHADPAHLARLTRHHWSIEALHWLRDTLYREDASQTRTQSGPKVMAGLRNLAIGALRLIGRTDITEATRWAGRFMHRAFNILNITR